MNIDAFLTEYKPAKSQCTRGLYRSHLTRYQGFLEMKGIPADEARSSDLRAFAEWVKHLPNPRTALPGISESTVQTNLSAVRSYYRWRKAHNPGMRNPGPEFRYRREQKVRKVRAIDSKTISLMCKHSMRKRDVAICRLFQESGLRLAGLIALNKDSIQIERRERPQGFFHLGLAKVLVKGNKFRTVVIRERALQAIADYLVERGEDSEPALFVSRLHHRISARAVQRLINNMSLRVVAGHKHPHQLRHSFGTALSEGGLPELDIQKRLGHDLLRTTHRYLETSRKNAMAQYRRATVNRMQPPHTTP